jgi:hypothetical protein
MSCATSAVRVQLQQLILLTTLCCCRFDCLSRLKPGSVLVLNAPWTSAEVSQAAAAVVDKKEEKLLCTCKSAAAHICKGYLYLPAYCK